jgi:hypothetical protein
MLEMCISVYKFSSHLAAFQSHGSRDPVHSRYSRYPGVSGLGVVVACATAEPH